MMLNQPFFMTNPDWYTVVPPWESEDRRGYHLTDKAPKEAIESYQEFYALLESMNSSQDSPK